MLCVSFGGVKRVARCLLSLLRTTFYFFSAFFSLVFVNTILGKVSACVQIWSTASTQSLFALSLWSKESTHRGGGKNNTNNGSSSSRAQIEPLGHGRREICPAILSHRGEVTNGTNLSRGGRRRRRVTREK